MRAQPTPITGKQLARQLAAALSKHLRSVKLYEEAGKLRDEANCKIEAICDLLAQFPAALLRRTRQRRRAADLPHDQKALRLDRAQKGVIAVKLVDLKLNGAASTSIEGGNLVPLTPAMADLLAFLIVDNGSSKDHLVDWKSIDQISRWLGRHPGKKKPSKRAIVQLVSRLRKQLDDYDENSLLILQDERWGYRFALRRIAEPVTGGDAR